MGRKKLLTDQKVLDVIRRWFLERGMAPTIEELRRQLGLGSTRTVLRYLHSLEESGEIERWPGARGIRPLRTPKKGVETRLVALVGEIAAGHPMVAEENIEGWIRLPKGFLKPESGKFFLLRVRGDSMNKASVDGGRIENGDLVLVRQQISADAGEIIVALIDGEATIKRFSRGPGYIVLKPESTNPEHRPFVLNRDFHVQGVVRRTLKKGSELFASAEHTS